MEIKIDEKTYGVKYGFRALLIYENIANESFQPKGLNSMLVLFYSCIMAANKDAVIDFDSFVDALDEQPEKLNEFTDYIVSMMAKNNNISEKEETSKKKASKKSK
jgi:hypothetical protein